MATKRSSPIALLFGASLLVAAQVWPQDFPSRQLRLIVPFPPGGPTDQVSRLLAQKIGENTGQTMVVENRPGGGAQIAASALMQAGADGYTLLIGDIGALAINSSLYKSLSYDPQRDFRAVSNVMASPMVMLVSQKSPANSVAQVVQLATKRPGGASYASQGLGTGGHLLGEMFKTEARLPLVHVPYKGSAPAMQDLIAGQVDVFFDVMASALPQARGGKVKLLAVAASQRSPRAPEVPTMAEAGYPRVEMTTWFGIVVRAGTPDAIVRALNGHIVSALKSPEISRRLSEVGTDPAPTTIEAFDALMRSERTKWAAVVKASGASLD